MKKIKALQNYTDTVLNKNIVKGEEYIVENERAEAITKYIYNNKPLAEIIEDVKELAVKENKSLTEEGIIDRQTFIETNDGKLLVVQEEVKESSKEDKHKTTTKKKAAKK